MAVGKVGALVVNGVITPINGLINGLSSGVKDFLNFHPDFFWGDDPI